MTHDKRIDYTAAIIVNLLLLYAAHNLLAWNTPYITAEYERCLLAIDLSFAANVLANGIYLFYDKKIIRGIGRIILNLIGLNFIYTLYMVYPFDFSTMPQLDSAAQIAFITGIIGIVLGTIMEALKLLPDKKPTSP